MTLPKQVLRYARTRGRALAEQAANNLPPDATTANIMEVALKVEVESRDTFPCVHYLGVINEMDKAQEAFEEFIEEVEEGMHNYVLSQE